MKLIEQKFNATLFPEGQEVTACSSLTCCCRDFGERQSTFSGLLLDIAWSVKVPSAERTEQPVNRCQIKRYNRVLNYLIQNNSASILGNVLHNLETLVKKMEPDSLVHCTCDCDVRLLHENMDLASDIHRKHQSPIESKVNPPSSGCCCVSSQKDIPSRILNFNKVFHYYLTSPIFLFDLYWTLPTIYTCLAHLVSCSTPECWTLTFVCLWYIWHIVTILQESAHNIVSVSWFICIVSVI